MLISGNLRAYVCTEPIDMRKSIDGLAALVRPLFDADPLSGQLYVFVSRHRTRVKVLYWDRHGFALWYKRLEQGRFPLPQTLCTQQVSVPELMAWLEGIDLSKARRLQALPVTHIA
jgi:transposase